MKLLFTLLIIVPLTIFGQPSDSLKTRKLAIGLTFSPDYCYRILQAAVPDKVVFVKMYNDLEVAKFGFTSGINLAFNISKRVVVEAAILFADKGYRTKEQTYVFFSPIGKPGIIDTNPDLPEKGRFIYNYNYIDVPLKINYYILTQKLKWYVTAAIAPAIFINSTITSHVRYRDGHFKSKTSSTTSSTKCTPINWTGLIGIGCSYNLSSRLYFKLEPTYRRSLTPINKYQFKEYLYSAGLTTGIFYKL